MVPFWLYTPEKGWKKNQEKEIMPWELSEGFTLFETLKSLKGRVLFLREHLQRMELGARSLGIVFPLTEAEMDGILKEGLSSSRWETAYIRIILLSHGTQKGLQKPRILILLTPLTLYGPELYEKGVILVTASGQAKVVESIPPVLKSGDYLACIQGRMDSLQQKGFDALFLNIEGYVTETTIANIFWIKKNRLYTPPIAAGALPGITRQKVIQLAGKNSLSFWETNGTLYDLYTAEEVFLANSLMDILPVVSVDGRVIGNGKPGSLTLRLLDQYRKLLQNMVEY